MLSDIQNKQAFQSVVDATFQEHKGERIYQFEFEGKKFWLKQPEKQKGIWRFLKPSPKTILREEVQQLMNLLEHQAPVPKLRCVDENYFVIDDFGRAANRYIDDPNISDKIKMTVLKDCVDALNNLHRHNLTHGRPALRDMLWDKCGVKFIDFEEHPNKPLAYLKMRDIAVFIHSLFRYDVLSSEQIKTIIAYTKKTCDPQVWQDLVQFLRKYKWLYWLLLPFKPIARVDLIAIYGVFEYIY